MKWSYEQVVEALEKARDNGWKITDVQITAAQGAEVMPIRGAWKEFYPSNEAFITIEINRKGER